MKKFTAILLAVVLILTCFAAVACKRGVVKVFLHYQDGRDSEIEVYNDSFTLPSPSRPGYDFGGWYLDEACSEGKEFHNGTEMSSSFHIYAKWTKSETPKYTVTFVYNDNKTDNYTVDVYEGEHVTFPSEPSREGYTFAGWYETQTGGVQWAENNPITKPTTLYARWTPKGGTDPVTHTHDFDGSYFTYVLCKNGCGIYGREESTNYYANVFVYEFNANKKAEIDACYEELQNYLKRANAAEEPAFETKFEEYDSYVGYVVEQYQYAYVFYCTYDDESYEEAYTFVSEYYNVIFANYYGLFATIYETEAYRYLFYDPQYWTEEDINEMLALAESYGGGSNNQNQADQIVTDYYNVLDEMDELYEKYSNSEITEDQYNTQYAALQGKLFYLYEQFVNVNNLIAQDAHYDNYMDYAYANVYGREYEPSDVAAMQDYVRDHIGPVIAEVAEAYIEMMQYEEGYGYYLDFSTAASEAFYYGLAYDSVFDTTLQTYDEFYEDIGWLLEQYYGYSKSELLAYWKSTNDEIVMANGYMSNYFKYLTSNTAGNKPINFYTTAEDLFEKGNYFVGTAEQAYTYYISAQNLSVLYFGGDDYTNAFTFIHEFGHYYNGIYNGGMNLSMDHDETQSQGNEMLFLAYLYEQTKSDSSLTEGFSFLELEQLFNMLSTIIMSTAVDELEQAAYSGSYANGDSLPTISATIDGEETSVIDYQTMYETILTSYWAEIGDYLNTEYWSYVVFDNAAYYISYAMSALPSLEIYVKARTQGIDSARDSYLKLFTFSDYESAVDADNDGYCSYQEILNWCGLKGPFEEELYSTISTYFSSRQ